MARGKRGQRKTKNRSFTKPSSGPQAPGAQNIEAPENVPFGSVGAPIEVQTFLQTFLTMPNNEQAQIEDFFTERRSSKKRRSSVSDTSSDIVNGQGNGAKKRQRSESKGRETSLADVIEPIDAPTDLAYHDTLKDRLVCVSAGNEKGAALMLSPELWKMMLASVDGNRKIFTRLSQRQTNKNSREAHDHSMEHFKADLEKQYIHIRSTCLDQPTMQNIQALSSIRARQGQLTDGQTALRQEDQQESDDVLALGQEQLELDYPLLDALEESLVGAGFRTKYEPPDFESLVPEFDDSILQKMDFDLPEASLPENDLDAEIYAGPELAACEDSTSLKIGPPKLTINVTSGLASHPIEMVESPLSAEQFPEFPEVYATGGATGEPTDAGDGTAVVEEEGQDNQPERRASFSDEHPRGRPPQRVEIKPRYGYTYREDESPNPTASYIIGIGYVNVYPLDEWAPLLKNPDALRADVWKHNKQVRGAQHKVDLLQRELEKATTDPDDQDEAGTEEGETAESDHEDVAVIEARIASAKEQVRIRTINLDIAKYRARWMGLMVDDMGHFLDEDDDYFDFEAAKAIDPTAREVRIGTWREGIVPGFEDVMEEPDVEEWDAGAEIQPWEVPDEEYDPSLPEDCWSYKTDCQQCFHEQEEKAIASGEYLQCTLYRDL